MNDSYELYVNMRDHYHLFEHVVESMVVEHGIIFYIRREHGSDSDYEQGTCGFGAITVFRKMSLIDKLIGRTFNTRCDIAVEKLKEVCKRMNNDDKRFVENYEKSMMCALKWDVSHKIVPRETCHQHND